MQIFWKSSTLLRQIRINLFIIIVYTIYIYRNCMYKLFYTDWLIYRKTRLSSAGLDCTKSDQVSDNMSRLIVWILRGRTIPRTTVHLFENPFLPYAVLHATGTLLLLQSVLAFNLYGRVKLTILSRIELYWKILPTDPSTLSRSPVPRSLFSSHVTMDGTQQRRHDQ